MSSLENLTALEPSRFRYTFASDPWFSDGAGISPYNDSTFYAVVNNKPSPSPNPDTPRGSGSGSDPDAAPAGKPAGPGPASGKVGKRKRRPSKKNPTTYIPADAANFREMVQQFTGIKFPAAAQIPQILKPEPQRIAGAGFGGRVQGCLPTLDTSAFLLGLAGEVGSQAGVGAAAEIGGGGGGGGMGFDGLACFPTLDSWKAL